MVKRQLELNVDLPLESGKPSRRASMRSKEQLRRQSRSHWWFARMRQVVDDAHPGPAQILNAQSESKSR